MYCCLRLCEAAGPQYEAEIVRISLVRHRPPAGSSGLKPFSYLIAPHLRIIDNYFHEHHGSCHAEDIARKAHITSSWPLYSECQGWGLFCNSCWTALKLSPHNNCAAEAQIQCLGVCGNSLTVIWQAPLIRGACCFESRSVLVTYGHRASLS